MFTNTGARPGDQLILTKALGTGFVASSYREGKCPDEVLNAAISGMIQLNRDARDAALSVGVHAVTDITGFGLAGHAREMADASSVSIVLEVCRLPMHPWLHQQQLHPMLLPEHATFYFFCLF